MFGTQHEKVMKIMGHWLKQLQFGSFLEVIRLRRDKRRDNEFTKKVWIIESGSTASTTTTIIINFNMITNNNLWWIGI